MFVLFVTTTLLDEEDNELNRFDAHVTTFATYFTQLFVAVRFSQSHVKFYRQKRKDC